MASPSPTPPVRPSSQSVSGVGGQSRFKRLEKIGEGSFGDVFKALDQETNEIVAIKIINLEDAEEEIEDIREEITMLSECSSPYVTRYITSYTNGPELCIVMEMVSGGSVHDLLSDGPLDESYVAIITRELLKACDYLHSSSKIHRDIKAANVLLSSTGQVKLSDFGVTAKLTNTIQKRNTFVGTPLHMAPEVIQQSDYNEKADIWSIGITVIEMFVGQPPFHDVHPVKALFLIPKSDAPNLDNHPTASKALKEFVKECCQKDYTKRPSVKTLLASKFIRSAKKNQVLQELVIEHQHKQEASRLKSSAGYRQSSNVGSHLRGGSNLPVMSKIGQLAMGTNDDAAGEDMLVVEEGANDDGLGGGAGGEDGEDGEEPGENWSFTVRGPSTTKAAAAATTTAQSATPPAASPGTAAPSKPVPPLPSAAQSFSRNSDLGYSLPITQGTAIRPPPVPATGGTPASLTNTLPPRTHHSHTNTVRGPSRSGAGAHARQEDDDQDVSSGSGSDSDREEGDGSEEDQGTVRMASVKHAKEYQSTTSSLHDMFHRPSILGPASPNLTPAPAGPNPPPQAALPPPPPAASPTGPPPLPSPATPQAPVTAPYKLKPSPSGSPVASPHTSKPTSPDHGPTPTKPGVAPPPPMNVGSPMAAVSASPAAAAAAAAAVATPVAASSTIAFSTAVSNAIRQFTLAHSSGVASATACKKLLPAIQSALEELDHAGGEGRGWGMEMVRLIAQQLDGTATAAQQGNHQASPASLHHSAPFSSPTAVGAPPLPPFTDRARRDSKPPLSAFFHGAASPGALAAAAAAASSPAASPSPVTPAANKPAPGRPMPPLGSAPAVSPATPSAVASTPASSTTAGPAAPSAAPSPLKLHAGATVAASSPSSVSASVPVPSGSPSHASKPVSAGFSNVKNLWQQKDLEMKAAASAATPTSGGGPAGKPIMHGRQLSSEARH